MSKINELRAQRAKTWEQTKAFLDSHRSDKGVLSAEDTATYEKMEQEGVRHHSVMSAGKLRTLRQDREFFQKQAGWQS